MVKQNQYFPQTVPHPGKTLDEKLEELNMGPKEFSLRTGKPEKTIIAVLKGDSNITPDMAILFENVTQIPANYWLNHQRHYDEFKARLKHNSIIQEAIIWARKFPINEMVKKNWLPKSISAFEKSAHLLSFFGFSTHRAWEEYYLKQQLKIAFRISLSHSNEQYAISAWIRKGEIQANELNCGSYSEIKFIGVLKKSRRLMIQQPKDFFIQLQILCLEAGVKLVHTPCIKKAPINGATRWLNNTPLIQLSGRHNRNDVFWFTFFHEAGHIILHGKKDIFLEDPKFTAMNKDKEKEADDFAIKWTFNENDENTILNHLPLTDSKIKHFAKQFNTHPAIIVGRLQRTGKIGYNIGNKHFKQLNLE